MLMLYKGTLYKFIAWSIGAPIREVYGVYGIPIDHGYGHLELKYC